MPRLFTAFPMLPEVRAELTELQADAPGVQWQKAENFHLTLNFIGQVNEKLVPALKDVLYTVRTTAPFQLCCSGVGYFGRPESPSVLWAGVEPASNLEALQRSLAEPMISHGFRPDARRYHPHITLGRHAPEEAAAHQWLERHKHFHSESFIVSKVVLYESRFDDGELCYKPIASVTLGGPEVNAG